MKFLCMGETLLRYSTVKGKRISDLDFDVHIGGSETNVAVSLANFGFECTFFSKISDNVLGDTIIKFLNSYNVNTNKIIRSNNRVGSYYLENGSGNRTSQVIYDRANSAMTTLNKNDINIATLFEGIDVFVVSGITVALSKEVEDLVIEMMKYCNENKIKVVYDSNYRAKLWSLSDAGDALKKILPYVNILSAGSLDAINLLQMSSDIDDDSDKLLDFYNQITSSYPNIEYAIATKRKIISTTVNDLTGYLYYQGKLYSSSIYHIDDIVDRVGGGDAFMSGVLAGLFSGETPSDSLEFGVGASVLKHTIHGDVNQFNKKEVESFVKNGIARISR